MKRTTLLLLVLLQTGMTGALWAQNREYFPFFQQEWFFGNLPGAATEAMGRADVAVGGSVSSMFYNPAGIGTIDSWEATFSTSAPYYVLRESDYFFAGYAKRLSEKLVAGLTWNHFAVGPTNFTVQIDGVDYPMDKPATTVLALTAAYEPLDRLQVGVSGNLFVWKLFDDVSRSAAPLLDVGALYAIQESENSRLQAGFGLTNASFSQITFSSPANTSSTSAFPVIARMGLSYQRKGNVRIPGLDPQPVRWLATAEFTDVLNSPYRTGLNAGSEVVLAEMLALRLGFHTRTEDDGGFANNRARISDVTYGFGLILPLDKLGVDRLPARLHVDYTSLENPPAIFSGPRLPNKRMFAFRLIGSSSR